MQVNELAIWNSPIISSSLLFFIHSSSLVYNDIFTVIASLLKFRLSIAYVAKKARTLVATLFWLYAWEKILLSITSPMDIVCELIEIDMKGVIWLKLIVKKVTVERFKDETQWLGHHGGDAHNWVKSYAAVSRFRFVPFENAKWGFACV